MGLLLSLTQILNGLLPTRSQLVLQLVPMVMARLMLARVVKSRTASLVAAREEMARTIKAPRTTTMPRVARAKVAIQIRTSPRPIAVATSKIALVKTKQIMLDQNLIRQLLLMLSFLQRVETVEVDIMPTKNQMMAKHQVTRIELVHFKVTVNSRPHNHSCTVLIDRLAFSCGILSSRMILRPLYLFVAF